MYERFTAESWTNENSRALLANKICAKQIDLALHVSFLQPTLRLATPNAP